jgi:hypothetical protein
MQAIPPLFTNRKRLLLFLLKYFLFAFVMCTVNANAQPVGATINNPIEMGTYGAGTFSYTDTKNNSPEYAYGNELGNESDDIYYRFTIQDTTRVRIAHCGSGFNTRMLLLNNIGNIFMLSEDDGPLCSGIEASIITTLYPGTYYIVSEGSGQSSGNIITSLTLTSPPPRPLGATINNPIEMGTYSGGTFSYTDTKNNSPENDYGNELGYPSDDIYYRFTIQDTTIISISHCSSSFNTNMYLLNSNGNIIRSNGGYGPYCESLKASMGIKLLPGTYYIVSEGRDFSSGTLITSVNIVAPAPNPVGATKNNPIEMGTYGVGTFSYTDTRNNSLENGYGDEYGYEGDDIYYRFTIQDTTIISISHCGSGFSTVVHLLNSNGFLVESHRGYGPYCASLEASLNTKIPPGTYYIVSEGYSYSSGNLITSVNFFKKNPATPVGATMGNPIEMGYYGTGTYSYSDTIMNTLENGYGNEYGQESHDVFHRFTIQDTTIVSISHCGSGFDTYMHLLNSNGNLIKLNDDDGPYCTISYTEASIGIKLSPGTYYIVSEGYAQASGKIITSVIFRVPPPKPAGATMENPIEIGSYGIGTFYYTDTRNNSPENGYGNEFGQEYGNIDAEESDDIYYRLTVQGQTRITISTCGSRLVNTVLHFLSSTGEYIAYDNDYYGSYYCPAHIYQAVIDTITVEAGTYYIVVEGRRNLAGEITTSINFTVDGPIVSDTLFNGGCINTAELTIPINTAPPTINASAASQGSCGNNYNYQWQVSTDNIFFKDIDGATSQNLTYNSPINQTTYFQRKVSCGSEVKYTQSVSVNVSTEGGQ